MSGKKASKSKSLAERLELLLAKEEKADKLSSSTHDELIKVNFWSDFRDILARNEQSQGIEILDDIAEALLEDRLVEAVDAFSGTVVILPVPSRQRTGAGAPDHPRFSPHAPKRPILSEEEFSDLVQPPKKRKGNPKKAKVTPPKAAKSVKKEKVKLDLIVAARAPVQLKEDLDEIYRQAATQKAVPYQLAYPWSGQVLWYDPEAYPDIHVAHWRFWNAHRSAFFQWALHVPLETPSAQTQRRKAKMAAVRERLRFVSLCIETWGWYSFLGRLE